MGAKMQNSVLRGVVKKDRRTKNLCKRLCPHDFALLVHENLDAVAAQELAEKKVNAVLNVCDSFNGEYPVLGAQILINEGILLLDNLGMDIFNMIEEGDAIEIRKSAVICRGTILGRGRLITKQLVQDNMLQAEKNLQSQLDLFVENTLEYARREKNLLLGTIALPNIKTKMAGRHVLVVVRGKNYKQDLRTIQAYIREVRPVLIGVDGGADALYDMKLTPDMVIGDMDSIGDTTLKKAGEIIVHAYADGSAPGLARVSRLGLQAKIAPVPGTSEDLALLMAYENKALLIVVVGAHSNMTDFLEKGRKGMSSTFLVRLRVGERLVDARGLTHLYRSKIKWHYLSALLAAALFPIFIISAVSPLARHLFYLLSWKFSIY